LVLLPKTDGAGAEKPLERIRKRIEEGVFTENNIKITASIGAAVYPDHRPLSAEELIEFADAAMYEAKAKGKNRLVFYSQLEDKNEGFRYDKE
jgi:diguanylate cyclase (GGDEF)-like protein